MLENLNSVEWEKLSTAYGKATQIPHTLQMLEDAKNDEQYQEIYAELMNQINHQASVYSATVPTLEFLVQMLGNTSRPFRQILNCVMFCEFLRNTQVRYFSYSYPQFMLTPITTYRTDLKIYDTIGNGLYYFLNFLDDINPDVRTAGIYVLLYLDDKFEQSIPAILRCIETTSNQWIRAGGAWAYARLGYYSVENLDNHLDRLLSWVQNGDSFPLRLSATFGYLVINMKSNGNSSSKLSDVIIDTIMESFKTEYDELIPRDTNKLIGYMRSELLPYTQKLDIITEYSRRTSNPQLWIAIVKNLDLSSGKAHEYCRELIDVAFARRNRSSHHWDNQSLPHIGVESRATYDFKKDTSTRLFLSDKSLTKTQGEVLQAIVDCEPFWEIPTNLFSFYYGLPDEREALRDLIKSQSEKDA